MFWGGFDGTEAGWRDGAGAMEARGGGRCLRGDCEFLCSGNTSDAQPQPDRVHSGGHANCQRVTGRHEFRPHTQSIEHVGHGSDGGQGNGAGVLPAEE